MSLLIIGLLIVIVAVVGFVGWRSWQQAGSLQEQNETLQRRYAGIIDVDSHLAATKAKIEETKRAQQQLASENEQRRLQLSKEYEQGVAKYGELKKEVSLLEENLEDISFGLYKPHFTFQTSDEYKTALEQLREREKQLIRDGKATSGALEWTVGGSAKEGQRMAKQYKKILLRAFNGECDAALANVSWNNIGKMEERIRKSCDAISQLGGVMQFSITPEFLKLKVDELRLTHEYEEKKHQEREEQRRTRERLREEEKVQREAQKAREQAEEEEADYEKALAQAREETLKATGAQLEKLASQIQSLEGKLNEARQNKERAISRAEVTKSGFVYVISNIGSFGERLVKIGMTRRMEPMERIDELGDASVPFPFDLHVMLYSDNAPELESALHELMEDRRVNLVNPRKEFYEDVALDEIEAFVKQRGLSAQFMKIAEAKEYRETVALRQQRLSEKRNPPPQQAEKFAPGLFGASTGS